MSDEKSIEQIAVLLVRAHYDDELAFKDYARELAQHLDSNGKPELAGYVMAQYCDACTFSTMEVDPLPRIARDMFAVIEGQLGEGHPKTKEFVYRIAQYMPDFCERAREMRS